MTACMVFIMALLLSCFRMTCTSSISSSLIKDIWPPCVIKLLFVDVDDYQVEKKNSKVDTFQQKHQYWNH